MRSAACLAVVALTLAGSARAAFPAKETMDQMIQGIVQGVVQGVQGVQSGIAEGRADLAAQAAELQAGLLAALQGGAAMAADVPRLQLPRLADALKPKAWGAAATAYGEDMSAFNDQYGSVFESYADGFEAEFCTPAEFTPGGKKPATFTGPSASLTFASGLCAVDGDKLLPEDETVAPILSLNCTEPSVVLSKKPANWASKHKTAPSFTGKSCAVSKTFGEPVTKVLFVFDSDAKPDVAAITKRVADEIRGVLGGAVQGAGAAQAQLQQFLASLPKLPFAKAAPAAAVSGARTAVSGATVSGARAPEYDSNFQALKDALAGHFAGMAGSK